MRSTSNSTSLKKDDSKTRAGEVQKWRFVKATGLRPAEPTIPYSTVKQPTARAG